MEEEYWKKSGQIPAFGNWEYANELPITQYFECARQAVAGGLLRCSNSSGECDLYVTRGDLYAVDFKKPHSRSTTAFPPSKTRGSSNKNKRCPQEKEEKKQVKKAVLCDVTEPQPPRKQRVSSQELYPPPSTTTDKSAMNRNRRQPPPTTSVKAVDEDLYKIPPELLRSTKRKKKLGLFSRCLVPACMV